MKCLIITSVYISEIMSSYTSKLSIINFYYYKRYIRKCIWHDFDSIRILSMSNSESVIIVSLLCE